jgi:class 3 adenylate cyclase
MDRYFTEMKRIIERHGGIVEKYIGDAVMAVFGLPRVHEDDALRAARAASEMGHSLAALNSESDSVTTSQPGDSRIWKPETAGLPSMPRDTNGFRPVAWQG